MKIEYLNNSEYVLINNPIEQKSGLIFTGYKKANPRQSNRDINSSSFHKENNIIYSSQGVHPTILSRTKNCFILFE